MKNKFSERKRRTDKEIIEIGGNNDMPEDLFDKLVDWNMEVNQFVLGPREECEEFEALEMDGLEDEEVPF